MNELILVQFVSAALFVLTGALVLYVTLGTPSRKTRRAAIASLGTAAGACTFMLLAYAGEKPLDLQRAGPILRHAAGGGERGVFEYADTDVDEAGEASGAGLLRKAMWGGADDSKRPGKVLKDCPHCPELVIVPAGFFRIGAAAGDPDATANERPGQTVRISRPFAIGRHEVTVGQYAAFLKATGGQVPACSGARDIGDPRLPVTCVSWRDAKAYTTWLSPNFLL